MTGLNCILLCLNNSSQITKHLLDEKLFFDYLFWFDGTEWTNHNLYNNPNTFESAQIYLLSLPPKIPEFNVILQWSPSYDINCQRFNMAGRGN